MDKYSIAATLKSCRKSSGLSVKTVCEHLKQRGIYVSNKTIYGWENAYSQPDADTLLFLCKLYRVTNVLETFGYKSSTQNNFPLTEFEKKLVIEYRERLDMQKAVKILLGLESEE